MTTEQPTFSKNKKKKNKVRSAWISFGGRIVAQVIGAFASVGLGLLMLDRYAAMPPATPVKSEVAAHRDSGPVELSLAVLPLENYSGDPKHAYVADGLTEALITDLAQIPGLRVTSRTSSMAYKGTTKAVPEIARELGVDLILEGSLVREADRVRVTAQLIDAGGDHHLWAKSYDRGVLDLLSLQAEVATMIAKDVNLTVSTRLTLP